MVPGHRRRRPAGASSLRVTRRRVLPHPRRRPPVQDGLRRAHRVAHRTPRRHHAGGAASGQSRRHADGHLQVRPRRSDRRLRGEARPRAPVADRQLAAARRDVPADAGGQAVCRVDGHLRLLAPGAARGARTRRHRLRQGDHPCRARQVSRQRLPPPRLLGRCGNHRGLLRRQHHADASGCALPLPRSEAADLHQAAPPAAGTRLRRAGRPLRASATAARCRAATSEIR